MLKIKNIIIMIFICVALEGHATASLNLKFISTDSYVNNLFYYISNEVKVVNNGDSTINLNKVDIVCRNNEVKIRKIGIAKFSIDVDNDADSTKLDILYNKKVVGHMNFVNEVFMPGFNLPPIFIFCHRCYIPKSSDSISLKEDIKKISPMFDNSIKVKLASFRIELLDSNFRIKEFYQNATNIINRDILIEIYRLKKAGDYVRFTDFNLNYGIDNKLYIARTGITVLLKTDNYFRY